ncbi:MAG: hypothetical protein EOP11_03605 [Proteobacteria bacterium]|nr:MAG: hypothetical protein EOP11_03605 [Pseudomonadota bacterium]
MKTFSAYFVVLQFLGASFAMAAGGDLPTRAELEKELSDHYQASALHVLRAMDPSRDYAALVQVTIGQNAKWDELKPVVNELDYLPGTLKKNAENDSQRRFRVALGLPQKRSVLVLLPEDADDSIQEGAKTWIRKELRMGQDETVDFQTQIAVRKPEKAGEEKFYGSKLFWLAWIIAGTFLAALIIVMLARFKARNGAAAKPKKEKLGDEKPDQGPMQNFMQKIKQGLEPEDAITPAVGASQEEIPPSVMAELAAIERICRHDLDIASMAFGNLASRADETPLAAGVVQSMGIEKALTLFPKTSGSVWSLVGDAITAHTETEGLSLEDASHFRRTFSGEVARLQRSKDEVRMLPHLESLGGAEIARRIRSFGPAKGAMALGVLSENIISTVVPKMSSTEVANLLGAMMGTTSARLSDLAALDRDDSVGGAQDQVVEIEAARKCAIALSTMGASEEFATFDRLVATRGDRLYAEIAPFRLYPMHLHFIAPQAISEAMQSRELDDLKKMMGAVPQNLHEKLLSVMSERQRAIVESGDGSETDPEVLRSLLADLHTKQFLGQPHKLAETFGSRKVA